MSRSRRIWGALVLCIVNTLPFAGALAGEIKAAGGVDADRIGDDEQRRDRPPEPQPGGLPAYGSGALSLLLADAPRHRLVVASRARAVGGQRKARYLRYTTLAYLLLAFAASGAAEIRLDFDAAPEYRAAAARLQTLAPQRLAHIERIVGLSSTTSIHVLLTPEIGGLAGGVPAWVSGYAVPERGAVVLIPSRTVRYPNDELEDVLVHEIAHVMIDRAAAFQPVPRWFHEGVAMLAATGWNLEDRTRLAMAMISIGRVPLAQIERDFYSDEAAVSRAYAYSGAFIRDLVRSHGLEVIGKILAGVAAGDSFEGAFQKATGKTLAAAEEDFWSRQTLWNRWVPILSSSIVLWIAVTFLALLAGAARRRRSKLIMEQWNENDEEF